MPIPKPKAAELNDELLAYQRRGHFLDTSSVDYLQMEHKLRKQIKDDPFSGYGLYAGLCGLAGDVAGLRDYFKKALALTADPLIRANFAIALSNLGYFSEAASHLSILERPENGLLDNAINVSLEVGRVARTVRLIKKWNELHPDQPKDTRNLPAAAALLDKIGVSDDDLLPCLDIVGATMREHRLIFIGEPSIGFISSEESDQISFSFVVNVGPDECATLNCALVDSLFDSGVPLYEHAVHFGFLAMSDEALLIAA